MNPIMNKKIISHIQYNWIAYVLIAIAVILVWLTVFNALAQPEDNERISLIFYSDGWDSSILTAHLNAQIDSITVQKIKNVATEQASGDKAYLFQRLGTDMITNDIIVIDVALLDEKSSGAYAINPEEIFYELDRERLDALFGNVAVDYLTADGKAYGIYLNDPNDGVKNNFEKIYSGEVSFAVFFSRESVNLDQMNGLGNKGDTAAIDVVRYLLKIED